METAENIHANPLSTITLPNAHLTVAQATEIGQKLPFGVIGKLVESLVDHSLVGGRPAFSVLSMQRFNSGQPAWAQALKICGGESVGGTQSEWPAIAHGST